MRTKRVFYIICALFLFLWFWIAINIPYTSDDLNWGISAGIDHLVSHDINTRYAGNLIVVLLTRSTLLKCFVLGATYFLIPLLILKIIELFVELDYAKKSISFCFANILFLLLNYEVWRETYGWVSGAVNYVISALFLLLYVYFIFASLRGKNDKLMLLSSLFVGLIMQLFIENVAVYSVVVTAVVFGYKLYKEKKIDKALLLLLVGNIIGVVVVFSNSLIITLFKTGTAIDNYRKTIFNVSDPLFDKVMLMLTNYIAIVFPPIFARFNSLYSVILLFLLSGISVKKRVKNRAAFITLNCVLSAVLIADYICFQLYLAGEYIETAELILAVAVFSVGFVEIKAIFFDKKRKMQCFPVMFLWFSPGIIVAPLCLITETGFRLYITTNVCLIVLSTYLLVVLVKEWNRKSMILPQLIVGIFTIALFAKWVVVYGSIGTCTNRRQTKINDAILNHSETIVLDHYEYDKYIHLANPGNEQMLMDFREFYGIPDEVSVIFE